MQIKYDKSAADIRVGDLWGSTYQRNQDGVSALITFTEKEIKSRINFGVSVS